MENLVGLETPTYHSFFMKRGIIRSKPDSGWMKKEKEKMKD
jgi:hypothetical protein